MSGIKNKMSLTLDSSVRLKSLNFRSILTDNAQPKIYKKYLGESSDPHFVPASPLISRQWLSEQEEGELSRTCALALARVPHSDDMSDDPFQYIASADNRQNLPRLRRVRLSQLLSQLSHPSQ